MAGMLRELKTTRPQTVRKMQGFTIIELMIVVVLLVVLLSLAGPDFRSIIIATRIKNTSFDVFASLTQARSEAVTRNTTVTMAAAGGGWANGWTISCTDADVCKDPANTPPAPPLVMRNQNAYDGVTVSGSATSVIYSGSGRANATAWFSITAPNASDRDKRCVRLDASGRPFTKPVVTSGFSCP